MANNLQKLIYNLSAASQLCFIFAVLWGIQKKTLIVPIICTCTGIFMILCFALFFVYGRMYIAPIKIRITDIAPGDSYIAGYVVSYIFPLAGVAVEDIDIILCGAAAALLIILLPFIDSAIPNPLLVFRGYHFYRVSTENGMSGYLLISRRRLRNAKEVKTVKRVFEFLLIDTERK